MAWIPDVVTLTTIRSAAWGNPIRDRVIHHFANHAERDSTGATFVDGLVAYCQAERDVTLWRPDLGGWEMLYQPWMPWPQPAPGWVVIGTVGYVASSGEYRYRRTGNVIDVQFRVVASGAGGLAAGFAFVRLPINGVVDPADTLVGNGMFIQAANSRYIDGPAHMYQGGYITFWDRSTHAACVVAAGLLNDYVQLQASIRYQAASLIN